MRCNYNRYCTGVGGPSSTHPRTSFSTHLSPFGLVFELSELRSVIRQTHQNRRGSEEQTFCVRMSEAPPPGKEKRRKKRRQERTDSHADSAPSAVEMTSPSAPPAPTASIVPLSKPTPAETIIPVQDEEAQKGTDEKNREPPPPPSMSFIRIYLLFMSFGIKAWGGPAVQIQALKHEFVEVRKWISMGKFNRVLAVYQVCFISSLLDPRTRIMHAIGAPRPRSYRDMLLLWLRGARPTGRHRGRPRLHHSGLRLPPHRCGPIRPLWH